MPKQKRGLKGSADEKGRSNKQEKMGNNRTAATVRRLNMYKRRPIRDKHGKVTKQEYQSKELPNTRIVPDRRWFGNTRCASILLGDARCVRGRLPCFDAASAGAAVGSWVRSN